MWVVRQVKTIFISKMASIGPDFESKKQVLLKILPDLTCVRCKSVPNKGGPRRDRHSCVKQAHTICGACKDKKCPCCGSKVTQTPNPVFVGLIEDLPLACNNYQYGCKEIMGQHDDVREHEIAVCRYRKVTTSNANIFKMWMKGIHDPSILSFHRWW